MKDNSLSVVKESLNEIPEERKRIKTPNDLWVLKDVANFDIDNNEDKAVFLKEHFNELKIFMSMDNELLRAIHNIPKTIVNKIYTDDRFEAAVYKIDKCCDADINRNITTIKIIFSPDNVSALMRTIPGIKIVIDKEKRTVKLFQIIDNDEYEIFVNWNQTNYLWTNDENKKKFKNEYWNNDLSGKTFFLPKINLKFKKYNSDEIIDFDLNGFGKREFIDNPEFGTQPSLDFNRIILESSVPFEKKVNNLQAFSALINHHHDIVEQYSELLVSFGPKPHFGTQIKDSKILEQNDDYVAERYFSNADYVREEVYRSQKFLLGFEKNHKPKNLTMPDGNTLYWWIKSCEMLKSTNYDQSGLDNSMSPMVVCGLDEFNEPVKYLDELHEGSCLMDLSCMKHGIAFKCNEFDDYKYTYINDLWWALKQLNLDEISKYINEVMYFSKYDHQYIYVNSNYVEHIAYEHTYWGKLKSWIELKDYFIEQYSHNKKINELFDDNNYVEIENYSSDIKFEKNKKRYELPVGSKRNPNKKDKNEYYTNFKSDFFKKEHVKVKTDKIEKIIDELNHLEIKDKDTFNFQQFKVFLEILIACLVPTFILYALYIVEKTFDRRIINIKNGIDILNLEKQLPIQNTPIINKITKEYVTLTMFSKTTKTLCNIMVVFIAILFVYYTFQFVKNSLKKNKFSIEKIKSSKKSE